MSTPVSSAALPQKESHDDTSVVKPVIVRLENLPATIQNRKHMRDRVRDLNRILESSGTPFRLRLL